MRSGTRMSGSTVHGDYSLNIHIFDAPRVFLGKIQSKICHQYAGLFSLRHLRDRLQSACGSGVAVETSFYICVYIDIIESNGYIYRN